MHEKGREYVQYCMKQLHEDDYQLAKQYLLPFFEKKSNSPNK